MKKIKQFSLKATLLTIVAALTIGFTGCSDELSGDQTQGKPGYLTINLKNIKPVQTKLAGAASTDFQKINNLNLFVFNSGDNLLISKWYPTATGIDQAGAATYLPIQVNTLPPGCYVVAVANYGSKIDDITTYAQLEAKSINTIKDFATEGLHMTGRGDIDYTAASSYTYTATVKIAPVEAKITVDWTITAGSNADYYDVTGVYVVNAIAQTKMPIILNTTTALATGNINPTATTNNISLVPGTPATRTAMTGLAAVANRDFNFYAMTTNAGLLSDEKTNEITSEVLDASYTAMAKPLHYYVGENYNTDVVPANAGAGAIRIDNTAQNENTLVVVRVTPKSTAPAYIRALGHKYYTYELTETSNTINSTNLGSVPSSGFSVRRKTNYLLTFNLSEMGADEPFTRLSTLTVNVQAQGWDPATVNN